MRGSVDRSALAVGRDPAEDPARWSVRATRASGLSTCSKSSRADRVAGSARAASNARCDRAIARRFISSAYSRALSFMTVPWLEVGALGGALQDVPPDKPIVATARATHLHVRITPDRKMLGERRVKLPRRSPHTTSA